MILLWARVYFHCCSQQCWTVKSAVPLLQSCDPWILIFLVLDTFAEQLFSLVVVKMHSFPELFHFVDELLLFLFMARMQLQGAL